MYYIEVYNFFFMKIRFVVLVFIFLVVDDFILCLFEVLCDNEWMVLIYYVVL